jgi:hypothetical protein
MNFEASIVGAKLQSVDQPKKDDLTTFKSPEDYAHLSEEERKELTKKMMGRHKISKFAGGMVDG